MNTDTSQRPTRDDWLAVFQRELPPDALVVSVRWSSAGIPAVLSALFRWSRPYFWSALEAHWEPASGYFSLQLAMEVPLVSPSTTATSGTAPTARMRMSLLRLLSRYARVQELKLIQVGTPQESEVKSALSDHS